MVIYIHYCPVNDKAVLCDKIITRVFVKLDKIALINLVRIITLATIFFFNEANGMTRALTFFFFFQAEDGIRDAQESRGLGDVYKRQDYWGICSPP